MDRQNSLAWKTSQRDIYFRDWIHNYQKMVASKDHGCSWGGILGNILELTNDSLDNGTVEDQQDDTGVVDNVGPGFDNGHNCFRNTAQKSGAMYNSLSRVDVASCCDWKAGDNNRQLEVMS